MTCRSIPRLEGACLCGSIKWNLSDADVSQICVCHCQSCRRNSGSTEIPFCAVNRGQLWSFLKDSPTLKSSPSYCSRSKTTSAADAASTVVCQRYFCGKCSTSLAVETVQDPHRLWIPMGTLKDFDPSFVDPISDFHACCDDQADYATAISNLQPRCNELVIRILTHITALRLALLIRVIACIRWLIVNAVSVLQYHSTMRALVLPTHRQRIVPQLEGSCECGSIRWQASDVSMSKVCICHCESCQKCSGTTGIPFCALDRVAMRDALLLQGTSTLGSYSSSTIATRYFCTSCASPVAFQYNQESDMLWIPMGTFSTFDPAMLDVHVDSHIFCKEKKAFASALAKLPKRSDSGLFFHLQKSSYCGMVSERVVHDRCCDRRPLKA